MDAITKYHEHMVQIEEQLKELKAKLRKHKAMFNHDSGNWSLVGDLNHVSDQLKQINSFIK